MYLLVSKRGGQSLKEWMTSNVWQASNVGMESPKNGDSSQCVSQCAREGGWEGGLIGVSGVVVRGLGIFDLMEK